jgi:hypothetical protein
MKAKRMNLIWGIVLILAGGLFLVQNMGWFGEISPSIWTMIFAFISLLFFVTYFVSGLKEWGWLFPAFIFAGVSTTLLLATSGVDDPYVGAPVLIGVGLPFLAAFLINRKENWWALIPMWVMAVLTTIIFIVDRVAGEVIGTLFLWAVGLPFLVVYLADRSRKWALIPAFVLLAVGVIPLLAMQTSGTLIGAFVLFAVSLPFWIIFVTRQENWWALIPAGILTTLGVVAALSGEGEIQPTVGRWIGGVFFLGIGATFGVLWLRRDKASTGWAVYPAVILLLIGLLTVIFGEGMQEYIFAVAVILLGVWVLYNNLRTKKTVE